MLVGPMVRHTFFTAGVKRNLVKESPRTGTATGTQPGGQAGLPPTVASQWMSDNELSWFKSLANSKQNKICQIYGAPV